MMSTSEDLKNRYTDIDLSLRIEPLTGDFRRFTNGLAIKESIIRILLSSSFDIYNEPKISSIQDYQFENLSNVMLANIQESIHFNIKKYEKRVIVMDVDVSGDNSKQAVYIYIKYKIRELDIVEDFTYVVKRKI